MYINHHNPRFIGSNVETVEDCKGMTRKEILALLKEYNLVSPFYYLSSRATKQYYNDKKDNRTC